MTASRLWLNGERSGEHHLLDVASGKVLKTVDLGAEIQTTAGVGRACGRRFVSVYLAPDKETVVLQVDQHRFPLDGLTFVRHRSRLGGLLSQLTVERVGATPEVVRRGNLASTLLRKIDPAYDEIDGSLDDFLSDIPDIVNSERRREWIREIKDPIAGPWGHAR